MGEVIKGVFGKPSQEVPKQEEEVVSEKPKSKKEILIEKIESGTASEYELAVVKLLMEAHGGNAEVKQLVLNFSAVAGVLDGIDRYVASLSDFIPSNQVLATSEQYWMSLSDDELKEATLSSSESEWAKDPSRYLALRREWFNRVKRKAEIFE